MSYLKYALGLLLLFYLLQTPLVKPPPRINGVAIMRDSDNTKGSTKAQYGDIIIKKTY